MDSSRAAGPTHKIENIVATVNLGVELDLEQLAERLPVAEYNPDQFPGLILRLTRPRISALIFRTGKMVCTGAKNETDLKNAVHALVKLLNDNGADVPLNPEVQVQNIVASGSLNAEVDLEQAALLLDNAMYEPEQFPGLIYRMTEPRVVVLIFGSGKIVCTGAKSEKDVAVAVQRLYDRLKELGVLYVEEGGGAEAEEAEEEE
ncbi:TATA-box-binding protein [Thermoproteus tenax]|uniref:TATA-box-binding protein n=2 Tax=Thermoproteus tenax TaxID=2271 RepID=G4RMR1_THETK|nr:TATA-box-binding protein [Thermoproteus tenax]CAP46909.1 TATA-box binding protein [Thermoproteus tenax Kra 1]CCC80855.1 TATA-box binding protein (Box A binding protein) (TBP) [Thermoproteus tenax Kra 1]